MIDLILALALLGRLGVPCRGLPGVTQPTVTKDGPHTPAWSPGPTQAAVLKQKRDFAGNQTCGFLGGVSGTLFFYEMNA